MKEKEKESFQKILLIMDELREKCPWDKKQTIASLRKLTIEEVYELSEAISNDDLEEIKNELGDVLLHIIFYAKIASEKKAFDISDVISHLCAKLIRRHPHVYGDASVNNAQEVKKNWEEIKKQEGGTKKGILSGVPSALPPMVKSFRIQDKAKSVGFDWENATQVLEKCNEEFDELKQAIQREDKQEIESEFGDVLFSLINYARFLDIDPEMALEKTNKKFIRRFNYIENHALLKNKSLKKMSLKEMDAIWQMAKKEE